MLLASRLARTLTAAVDHDRWVMLGSCLGNGLGRRLDILSRKVRARGPTTEDDVHVLVSARLDDRSKSLFRDTHERVWI